MRYQIETIAFVAGASLMIIELVGSRIVAPHLGTSLFIWTSLIGVILAFLSAGYWWGGKLADKGASESGLSLILLAASISASSILILEPLLEFIAMTRIDIRLASTIGGSILFGPSAFLLGIISPYLVKLKIKDPASTGRTVGNLYAISTLGSIMGTFLGGFFLISFLGTSQIVIVVAVTLLLLSLLARLNKGATIFVAVGLIISNLLMPSRYPVLADIDTSYNRWLIKDEPDYRTKRPTRLLLNNKIGMQSGIYLDNPGELLFFYLRTFDLAFEIKPTAEKSLLLGAGAYTYPMHVAITRPKTAMHVVEIDPELIDIARQYFGYNDPPGITTSDMDARVFLNQNKERYDITFVDTFSSELSIPHHLTTVESAQKIKDSLTDDGLAVINVISARAGKNGRFLHALYKTYKKVFPEVLVVPVYPDANEDMIQNITFFAFNKKLTGTELDDIKNKIAPWKPLDPKLFSNNNIPELTDEFAPVERYISGFIDLFWKK